MAFWNKQQKKEEEENSNTISVTIRKETLNKSGFSKAIKHNYRLTKQKSVTNKNGIRILDLASQKILKVQKESRDIHSLGMKYYEKLVERDRAIVNSARRKGETGRVKYWSDVKHNEISEAVVHVGKGFSENINSDEAFELIMSNFNRWLVKTNHTKLFMNPVMHLDEDGNIHVHILFNNSDSKSGLKVNLNTKILESLQDEIAVGMDAFGLRRSAKWSENSTTKKRHEPTVEYKKRKDEEERQNVLLAKMAGEIEKQKAVLVGMIEKQTENINEAIKAKALELDGMGDTLIKRQSEIDTALSNYRVPDRREVLAKQAEIKANDNELAEQKKEYDRVNDSRITALALTENLAEKITKQKAEIALMDEKKEERESVVFTGIDLGNSFVVAIKTFEMFFKDSEKMISKIEAVLVDLRNDKRTSKNIIKLAKLGNTVNKTIAKGMKQGGGDQERKIVKSTSIKR
jgi:hypothetical protein